MKTEITNREGYKVSLHVEVEADDLKDFLDKTYREISRNLKVPGFRKGKVPKQVIDSHIGPDQVRTEAIKENLAELYFRAIEESEIIPVSEPELNLVDLNKDGKVIFDAVVYVKPEVEVSDYLGIEVESIDSQVTDEDIDEAVEELRERLATLEAVEAKPVEEGDYVLFDYKVLAEGISPEEASGSDNMIEVGAGQFIEGFDEQLIGARKGDIIDISINVPPEFSEESIAGKVATFKTLVKEIKQKVVPPADDNLVKETTNFETMEEFKENLRPRIEQSKKSTAEREVKSKLVKIVVDGIDIELPEPMVRRQIDAEMEEFAKELDMRGASIDMFFNSMGGSREQFEESIRERVVESLMSELVLDAIAEKEGVEVSDEEAEEYIRENAEALGGDSGKLIEMARERDNFSGIKANLRLIKAVDILYENAVFSAEDKQNGEDAPEETKEDIGEPAENVNNASSSDVEADSQEDPSKEGAD